MPTTGTRLVTLFDTRLSSLVSLSLVSHLSHAQGLAKMYPAGRIGHSTDIGMLTLLLCAPASAWITGTVLPIDGGLTAYCRM